MSRINSCVKMHEIGITENLIKSVRQEISRSQDMSRVKKLYIKLGRDSGISEESIRFWFENLSRETELAGSSLEFISSKGNKVVVDSLEVE